MNLTHFKSRCMDMVREIGIAVHHQEESVRYGRGATPEWLACYNDSSASALERACDIAQHLASKLRQQAEFNAKPPSRQAAKSLRLCASAPLRSTKKGNKA